MKHQLKNDNLLIEVDELGAQLTKIFNLKNKQQYLWSGDSQFWGRISPVLFPIVGKLKDDTYTYQGKMYQLTQHGFARDSQFVLTEKKENQLTLTLTSNEMTYEKYPFHFELQCCFELIDTTIKVSYTITNKDTKEMYYSIGAHPAFSTAREPFDVFEDYMIEFEANSVIGQYHLQPPYVVPKVEKISIERLPLRDDLFVQDTLIYQVVEGKNSVSVVHKSRRDGIRLTYGDCEFLGIWTVKNAPFICIEPWQGIADTIDTVGELMQKFGIRQLNGLESSQFNYEIAVF